MYESYKVNIVIIYNICEVDHTMKGEVNMDGVVDMKDNNKEAKRFFGDIG